METSHSSTILVLIYQTARLHVGEKFQYSQMWRPQYPLIVVVNSGSRPVPCSTVAVKQRCADDGWWCFSPPVYNHFSSTVAVLFMTGISTSSTVRVWNREVPTRIQATPNNHQQGYYHPVTCYSARNTTAFIRHTHAEGVETPLFPVFAPPFLTAPFFSQNENMVLMNVFWIKR